MYAADQLLFDISVIFLQRLLLVVFFPHSFLPMWQHPSDKMYGVEAISKEYL